MEKNIIVLGSTGSIGRQTLDVARNCPGIMVRGLAAHTSVALLEEQAREFLPEVVAVADENAAMRLREKLSDTPVRVLAGTEGVLEAATLPEADMTVNAMVGHTGLLPTMAAIRAGKDIALANKETLVMAGQLVTKAAEENHVVLYPVDSEHSAIFQCLEGNRENPLQKIYLTASGGPFKDMSLRELEKVTVQDALAHPNWSMGPKITVDSASMMNKGLEVIEAKWLFGVGLDKIEVLIHPQSIVHSMVEYADGAVIAQLGMPDMRVPIQYALTYPMRVANPYPRLDLVKAGQLTFEAPDMTKLPCLTLAYEAMQAGGAMPAVLNAANEVAVAAFLNGRIGFTQIPVLIEKAMESYAVKSDCTMDDILEADRWGRDAVCAKMK